MRLSQIKKKSPNSESIHKLSEKTTNLRKKKTERKKVNDGQQAVNGWSAKREKLPLGFFFVIWNLFVVMLRDLLLKLIFFTF